MTLTALLEELRKQNIQIHAVGGDLKIQHPKGTQLNSQLLESIKTHKSALLSALRGKPTLDQTKIIDAAIESFEERASIREFDGGLSREEAETQAHQDVYRQYNVNNTWFQFTKNDFNSLVEFVRTLDRWRSEKEAQYLQTNVREESLEPKIN